jgi:hypothetical protein
VADDPRQSGADHSVISGGVGAAQIEPVASLTASCQRSPLYGSPTTALVKLAALAALASAARVSNTDYTTVKAVCHPELWKSRTYLISLNVTSKLYWPFGAVVGTVQVHSKDDDPHGQLAWISWTGTVV